MARTTQVTVELVPLQHEQRAPERPGQQQAPRWMARVPRAALIWAFSYGAVRVWWAIAGAPSPEPLGTDLVGFTGWPAAGLCAAAAAVVFTLGKATWRWPLLAAAWAVSAALLVASALLLLDVVGALLPGLRPRLHPVAFLSRVAVAAGAALVGATAVGYRRRWRSDCLFCGRASRGVRAERPPGWAWWAAYAAVAGCLVRLGAQVAVGFDFQQDGGASMLGFEVGFLLAGVVLPLALVHRWGRVFPRWVPLLAGRRVPRWLLLWPALALAGGMTAYFGFSIVKLAGETLAGTWDPGADALPLAFFWVAVPGYLVWGLGLGAAAIAYQRDTRPVCRVCGRPATDAGFKRRPSLSPMSAAARRRSPTRSTRRAPPMPRSPSRS